jgi:hypothetical protein
VRATLCCFVWMGALCGCATSVGDIPHDGEGQESGALSAHAEDADALAFQRILGSMRMSSATGPGCPIPPSWEQEGVPEGNAFTLTFHQMELVVSPLQTPITKELYCDVSVEIESPGPVSWSVTEFQYAGFASLKEGMSGALGVRYDFVGSRGLAQIPEFVRELPVPMDDNFFYDADPVRVAWSPCTTASTLSMRLRIVLRSENAEEAGLITLSHVDGRLAQVRVDLASRSCASSGGGVIRR